MTTIKPKFPTLSPAMLGDKLEAMKAKVEESTGADGQVDVEKLKAKVAEAKDPGLTSKLKAVIDTFQREESRRVTSSCGSIVSTRDVTVRVDPTALDRGEVANVMSALMHAKTAAAKLDTNKDGVLSEDELKVVARRPELESAFLRGAITSSLSGYQAELGKWNAAVAEVAGRIGMRERYSSDIDLAASFRAATPAGADALRWTYRNMMVASPANDRAEEGARGRAATAALNADAEGAESSLLRHLPFWNPSKREGHLSDNEIKALLGTSDLMAYSRAKSAEVLGKVGDWNGWLKGADLELSAEAAALRGATRVRSNC